MTENHLLSMKINEHFRLDAGSWHETKAEERTLILNSC